ncbi:MAG: outer membrane lipoprotein-sorting protein [Nitrospinota bacterium]|nr:MAG: outer membrane lipoprotein-sorting protein [Nitrospinota bacterium]
MRYRQWAILLTLLLLFWDGLYTGILALSDTEEASILQQLQQRQTAIPYQGTIVSITFSSPVARSSTFQVYALRENVERWERLLPSGDPQGVVLLDGVNRWEYIPTHHLIIKSPLSPRQRNPFKNLQTIRQNYRVEKIGETELANRQVLLLKFTPRMADRPQRLIWVDQEYHFPLRVEVYGVNGELFQLMTFTRITLYPNFPQETFTLQAPQNTTVLATEKRNQLTWNDLQQFLSFTPLFPHYLPPGFVLEDIKGEQTPQSEAIQLLYTDGLSYLSIFQEKAPSPPSTLTALTSSLRDRVQEREQENLIEYSGLLRMISGQKGGVVYAIVGEVIQEELFKIAQSLRPSPHQE